MQPADSPTRKSRPRRVVTPLTGSRRSASGSGGEAFCCRRLCGTKCRASVLAGRSARRYRGAPAAIWARRHARLHRARRPAAAAGPVHLLDRDVDIARSPIVEHGGEVLEIDGRRTVGDLSDRRSAAPVCAPPLRGGACAVRQCRGDEGTARTAAASGRRSMSVTCSTVISAAVTGSISPMHRPAVNLAARLENLPANWGTIVGVEECGPLRQRLAPIGRFAVAEFAESNTRARRMHGKPANADGFVMDPWPNNSGCRNAVAAPSAHAQTVGDFYKSHPSRCWRQRAGGATTSMCASSRATLPIIFRAINIIAKSLPAAAGACRRARSITAPITTAR